MDDMLMYFAMAAAALVALIVLASVIRFAVGIIIFLIVIAFFATLGIGFAAIVGVVAVLFSGLRHMMDQYRGNRHRQRAYKRELMDEAEAMQMARRHMTGDYDTRYRR